jgi:hypothetical protein
MSDPDDPALRRTAVPPTSDQSLWVTIRNATNALGFRRYRRVGDGAEGGRGCGCAAIGLGVLGLIALLRRLRRR